MLFIGLDLDCIDHVCLEVMTLRIIKLEYFIRFNKLTDMQEKKKIFFLDSKLEIKIIRKK